MSKRKRQQCVLCFPGYVNASNPPTVWADCAGAERHRVLGFDKGTTESKVTTNSISYRVKLIGGCC